MSDKIKVLVVDDSSFMRNVLSRMIEKDDRFEVIGKAVNGQQGVEMAEELNPDIITMDIEMPVMTGIEALEKIMSTNPRRVVMVSSLTEEGAEATLESLEKGAVDFIPKALQDKERNIFHSAGSLHEKLIAASRARVSRAGAMKPTMPARSSAAAPTTKVVEPVSDVEMRSRRKEKFPMAKLLLIGSSTGGPRALQEVIPQLPANLPVPVVIAQHMPANFTKAMATRLNSSCALEIKEAQHGDVLEKGHVYLAPGGMLTRVARNGTGFELHISEDTNEESVYHPSVDVLAASVSEAYNGNLLAVMLTGMGSDGAKEYAKLRKQGAYVIAQDEETSVVFGMPKSVIAEDGACEILALNEVAPALKRLLS